MIYEYVCESCNSITEIERSIKDEIPKTISCLSCKKKATRRWKASISIPEHFKALSEVTGGDSYANLDNLKSRFKHAPRPSGRGKVYY